LFDGSDAPFIPETLRPGTHDVLASEDGDHRLLVALRRVAGFEAGPVSAAPTMERPSAERLRWDDAATTAATSVPGEPAAASNPAVATWRRELKPLQAELAVATGEQQFAIREAIDEAEQMITKLESTS
jgi:hypothetical protein